MWTLLLAAAFATEPPGTLQVNVAPAGAEVVVDGERRGTGSSRVVELPAGAHTVSLALDGYVPEERVIAVQPGERVCIAVTLAREASPISPDPTDERARRTREAIAVGVVAAILGASPTGHPLVVDGGRVRRRVPERPEPERPPEAPRVGEEGAEDC